MSTHSIMFFMENWRKLSQNYHKTLLLLNKSSDKEDSFVNPECFAAHLVSSEKGSTLEGKKKLLPIFPFRVFPFSVKQQNDLGRVATSENV